MCLWKIARPFEDGTSFLPQGLMLSVKFPHHSMVVFILIGRLIQNHLPTHAKCFGALVIKGHTAHIMNNAKMIQGVGHNGR